MSQPEQAEAFGQLVYFIHRLQDLQEPKNTDTISHRILNIPRDTHFQVKDRVLPDDMAIRSDINVNRTAQNLLGEYEFLADQVANERPRYKRTARFIKSQIEDHVTPTLIPPKLGESLNEEERTRFIRGYNWEVKNHSVFLRDKDRDSIDWNYVPVESIDLSPFQTKILRALWIRNKIFVEDGFKNRHLLDQLGYEPSNNGARASISAKLNELDDRGIISWEGQSYEDVELSDRVTYQSIEEDVNFDLDQRERRVLKDIYQQVKASSTGYIQEKQDDMADRCHMSTGNTGISGVIQSLEEKGWIAVQRNKRPFRYYIIAEQEDVAKGVMRKKERQVFTSYVILKDDSTDDTTILSKLHNLDQHELDNTLSKFEELGVKDISPYDPEFSRMKEDEIEVNSSTLSELI